MRFTTARTIRSMESENTRSGATAANRKQACSRWQNRMIGDKLIDMEAGRNYGVRTVLVGTGYGAGVHEEQKKKGDFPYDLYADDLLEAYNEINRETAGNL